MSTFLAGEMAYPQVQWVMMVLLKLFHSQRHYVSAVSALFICYISTSAKGTLASCLQVYERRVCECLCLPKIWSAVSWSKAFDGRGV